MIKYRLVTFEKLNSQEVVLNYIKIGRCLKPGLFNSLKI